MLNAILGLSGALLFGSADFLGGIAAKRMSPMLVTAIAALGGMVTLLLVLPFVGGVWSQSTVLWSILAGLAGSIAVTLLYACLAVGPMSILSPLTAIVSAVVPMTAGLLGGDRFAAIGYWALGLALLAVVLVGFVPEKGAVRPSLKALLMAIGSGSMIGTFMILVDLTPDESGVIPLVVSRAVNAVVMFTIIGVIMLTAAVKRAAVPTFGMAADTPRRGIGIRLALAAGVVDVVGNTLILLGMRVGDLSVTSVLMAMYPAGTILLAAVVLKERIAPVQWVGLVLALVAAAMLAVS